MKRTEIREVTFSILYTREIQKDLNEEELDFLLEQNNVQNKADQKDVKKNLFGVQEHIKEIDDLISENLKEKWTIERISKINLSILRLAIYELLYTEVPFKVVVNEAVELAKKYGEDNSKIFVNGVLASVIKNKNIN